MIDKFSVSVQSLLLASAVGVATSCSAPSVWAEGAENKLTCGMTIKDVSEHLGELSEVEASNGWRTHFYEKAGTTISFGFAEGKLKLLQISWEEKPTRLAYYQVVDLCGDAPANLDATHRLPVNLKSK